MNRVLHGLLGPNNAKQDNKVVLIDIRLYCGALSKSMLNDITVG